MGINTAPLLCQADEAVLLVIDIQQRLAAAMPEKVLKSLLKHTGQLLKAAELLNIPIIQTEQYPKGLGETLADIQQHIQQDTRLEKTCFSCCAAEGFTQALSKNQRKHIVLVGMESHVCVLQTAMQLSAEGYAVFVVGDASCSRNKHHHKNALQRMQQAGIIVTNSESILFEWLRDARHPQFKAISQLLR